MLRVSVAFVFIGVVATSSAGPADNLIGSWKWDDGKGYSEIHFRPDKTFTWFTRISMKNKALVLAAMSEVSGEWQVRGDRLKLDGTERPLNEPFHDSVRFNVSNRGLKMQRRRTDPKVDNYMRFALPVCESARSTGAIDRRNLIGSWRCHYRTHDAEFVFREHSVAALYAWDVGKRMKVFDLIWKLSESTITMREPHGTINEEKGILWKVTRFSKDCFTVRHGSMTYTLLRTRTASNQAMQLTAGRSEFALNVTSTFNPQPCSPSPAVADLVSR